MFRAMVMAALVVLAGIGAAGADQRDPRLPALFERLRASADPAEASGIDRQIWSIWLESGDPAIDLILEQGTVAMAAHIFPLALATLTEVVERAPAFAEGWNKRATLLYLMSEYEASIRDCERVLALEPRHFGALSGLGLIHLQLGKPADALDWFRKALAVHPHMEGIKALIPELEEKVRGKAI